MRESSQAVRDGALTPTVEDCRVADSRRDRGRRRNQSSGCEVRFPKGWNAMKRLSEVLTVDEVAAYLKVHPSTIYRLVRHKALPGFKVGSDWRFTIASIEKWIVSLGLPGEPMRCSNCGTDHAAGSRFATSALRRSARDARSALPITLLKQDSVRNARLHAVHSSRLYV